MLILIRSFISTLLFLFRIPTLVLSILTQFFPSLPFISHPYPLTPTSFLPLILSLSSSSPSHPLLYSTLSLSPSHPYFHPHPPFYPVSLALISPSPSLPHPLTLPPFRISCFYSRLYPHPHLHPIGPAGRPSTLTATTTNPTLPTPLKMTLHTPHLHQRHPQQHQIPSLLILDWKLKNCPLLLHYLHLKHLLLPHLFQ